MLFDVALICVPSTTSIYVSLLGDVSIVTTPLSPADLNASAIKSPSSVSLLADILETWFNLLSSTGTLLFSNSFIVCFANAVIPFLISLKEYSSPF